VDEEPKSFHFIHLTFQEYFAASCFVAYWLRNVEIQCIQLRSNQSVRSTSIFPHILLSQETYAIHYNMMWCYTAGLLHDRDKKNGRQLRKFFEWLNAEPKDLLGPTHQILLAQCLEELPTSTALPPDFSKCRANIERSLSRWLLLQCKMPWGSGGLRGDLKYPEQLVYAIFQRGDFDTKMVLWTTMIRTPRVYSEILGLAYKWVTEGHTECHDIEGIGLKLIQGNDRETK
jgi:hypothetical protein